LTWSAKSCQFAMLCILKKFPESFKIIHLGILSLQASLPLLPFIKATFPLCQESTSPNYQHQKKGLKKRRTTKL
jgi:hypothetical protein